jgi:hypothetical protein
MRIRISVAAIAALVGCGSNGNNVTCGDGTTLVDGVCEIGSGGSGGGGDTCGSGTMQQGTTCVATGGGDASTPTISMMTPGDDGIFGGDQFEIDGTGFAGDNVTTLSVFFGDTTNMDCQASIGPATSTVIVGVIPEFCDLNVAVSVITNIGTATTPFHYDAIFAADGDGGGQFGGPGGFGGDVYMIDPFTGKFLDLGSLADGSGNGYGIDGMTFDATGENLWAETTGDSPADIAANPTGDFVSILLSVDITTGATTAFGNATDGTDNYVITDVKMYNGKLYGWAYDQDALTQGLVTIDTTSNAITPVGTLAAESQTEQFFVGGLAPADSTGSFMLAANGAGSDANDGATGELDGVDATAGAITANAAALDWFTGSPINAMEVFETQTIAILDDGFAGFFNGLGTQGETLAIIDPTAASGAVVNPVFALPALTGFSSAVDALAVPPATTTLSFAGKRPLPHTWQQLAPVAHGHASSLHHK